MSPEVKILNVDEILSNTLYIKFKIYTSYSILVKYDYPLKVVFIVNRVASKITIWD